MLECFCNDSVVAVGPLLAVAVAVVVAVVVVVEIRTRQTLIFFILSNSSLKLQRGQVGAAFAMIVW